MPAPGQGKLSCDVLVVGAGPAGSAAARAAAAAGADVIMLDRRRVLGQPARCAGFVPLPALSLPELSADTVIQRIDTMLTFTPDGVCRETASPGYIVRREQLDRSLAGLARRAGARVFVGARALSRHGETTSIETAGGPVDIRSAITIGADGPISVAGSWIGAANRSFAAAAQCQLPLQSASSAIRIHFSQSLPGGYGWLFPSGGVAKVGIGIERGIGLSPREALKWFVRKMVAEGLVQDQPTFLTGGLIPVGGPTINRRGSILLAGDAAGLCHPLSGAGVALALESGRLAGSLAAEAAMGRGATALSGYSEEIESIMGETLRRAVARRRRLYRHTRGSLAGFCRDVSESWMT